MKGHQLGKENRFAVVTDGQVYFSVSVMLTDWSFDNK